MKILMIKNEHALYYGDYGNVVLQYEMKRILKKAKVSNLEVCGCTARTRYDYTKEGVWDTLSKRLDRNTLAGQVLQVEYFAKKY